MEPSRAGVWREAVVSSPTGTQAIDRAALLLTQVIEGTEPASFTELAAASGLAKSTTSRLLTALERHQLVRRDPDGRFWPGELFVRYAWQGTADADLVAVAQPFLDRLGELTGETINLGIESGSIESGNCVQQVAQVNSRYMIGGTNWVGLAVPLHCSASGKVLLAYGAAELPTEPMPARTERTITSRSRLQAELALVRERGFAVTDEELEPGLVAVAAPVFAGGQAAIAAISVSGPASRLGAGQLPAAATHCVEVAQALSSSLGGQIARQRPDRQIAR
jgi:IclR family transcriptional regulator, acetate operon repressor